MDDGMDGWGTRPDRVWAAVIEERMNAQIR